MTVRSRRVFGTLLNGDTTPLVGVVVPFSLQPGSFTGTASLPSDNLSATTNSAGYFQIDLWTNADGLTPSRWRTRLPGGQYVEFLLPYEDGSDIDFATLRSLGGAVEDAPDSWLEAVGDLIAAHNGSGDAHGGAIGGGTGELRREVFTPINNQSQFPLAQIPSLPHLSHLFVNGEKARFGIDYVINGAIITWNNRMTIESLDEIEIYYD